MRLLIAIASKADIFGRSIAAKAAQDGIDVTYDIVASEVAIKNAVSTTHYDAVITQAKLEAKPFSMLSLQSIAEMDEKAKLILVIPESSRGTAYCQQLLNINLLYGLFQKEATVPKVYELLRTERTRTDARAYYGIVLENVTTEKPETDINEIQSMANYVSNGSADHPDEDLKTRVDYMAKNCTPQEIKAVFMAVSEPVKAKIAAIPEYAAYFPAPVEQPNNQAIKLSSDEKPVADIPAVVSQPIQAVPKDEKESSKIDSLSSIASGVWNIAKTVARPKINITLPTVTPKDKNATVVNKYIRRRIIGVVGAYEGTGTTTTAVCLAKTISVHEPVTLIELPDQNKAGIYDTYNLDELIGPTFKSVPHIIAGGSCDLTSVSNSAEGINFFVSNPMYGYEDLTNEQIGQMINGTSDTVVIDLGSDLDDIRERGIANALTHIVVVYANSGSANYASRIKTTISELSNMRIPSIVIHINDRGKNAIEGFEDISVFDTRSVVTGRIISLGITGKDEKKLLEILDVTPTTRKQPKIISKKSSSGVVDIAVAGITTGVGTTYTTLMLADALQQKYRVAYFEFNPTDHMQRLATELGNEEPSSMTLNGIDIYYNMDYADFANRFRNQYDYVLIDFGLVTKLAKKRDIFASCQQKFVCIPTSPWRMTELDYESCILDDIDPNNRLRLLAPLSTKKTIKAYDVYKRCGKREISPIPYSEEPVGCNKDIAEYLKRLIW